jgi:transcriptional antiterminator NusG
MSTESTIESTIETTMDTSNESLAIRLKESFEWYVIKTFGPEGIEEKVRTCIETEIKLSGIEACVGRIVVPEEDIFEIKNGKKTTRTRKKFQGYIFIEMENTEEMRRVILSQQYISGFVGGEKSKPCPMDDEDITRILEDHFNQSTPIPKSIFKVGEIVRIAKGTFEGVEGSVKTIELQKGKMIVSVLIFGRITEVEIESWHVEKL